MENYKKKQEELMKNSLETENRTFYFPIIVGLSIYTLFSLLIMGTLLYHPIQKRYFNTHCDGKIFQNIPVNKNFDISDSTRVDNWLAHALIESFTFNNINYKKQFEQNKKYFTTEGWNQFQKFLENNNILENVIERQFIVTPKLDQAPISIQEGVFSNGHFGWVKEIPITLNYISDDIGIQKLTLEVIIIRTDMNYNSKGIAIAQIKLKS